jgi:hypothetical protein
VFASCAFIYVLSPESAAVGNGDLKFSSVEMRQLNVPYLNRDDCSLVNYSPGLLQIECGWTYSAGAGAQVLREYDRRRRS